MNDIDPNERSYVPREEYERLRIERDQLREALRQARGCMEWCVNLGADDETVSSLGRGIAVIDRAMPQ
jgi:hypothetical protein